MRSIVTTIGCVLTCVATCAATASAQSAVTEPQVVVAQAEVILKRAPDLARVTLATEVRDGKAAEARRKSAEAMTAVQAAVKAVGISGDAIHTSGFSLVPEMTYSSGKLSVRNYVVRNQIEIRIDDLDRLADVIDAANSPKNVAIAVGNPRFELKAREAAELDAVAAAVKAAQARAVAMATGAGQTLGPVLKIQQGQVYTTTPGPAVRAGAQPFAGRGGAGGGVADRTNEGADTVETPITPGEMEIHAQVTLTIAIR